MYYFLIGIAIEKIPGLKPPTLRQMLQHFLFFHKKMSKNKKESAASVVQNAIVLWEKFNIDVTKRIDKIGEKLIKEYDEWYNLNKMKNKNTFEQVKKRDNFVKKLSKVFEVSKSAPKRKVQADQSESPDSAPESKKSLVVSDPEQLIESTSTYGLRQRTSQPEASKSMLDLSTFGVSESSPSEHDNTPNLADPDYKEYYRREKKKVDFITKHVVSTIDATGLSDYQAARILTAVAQGLGHSLEDLNVSRTTNQRRRAENRILTAETTMKEYKVK